MACTAAAVALVSATVLSSQGTEASRYDAKAPSAHCCPTSQSTDCVAGVTSSIFWARKATDWRHTPSYVGSFVPYRPGGRSADGEGPGSGRRPPRGRPRHRARR